MASRRRGPLNWRHVNGAIIQIQPEDGTLELRHLDFVYMAMRDAEGAVSGVLVHGVDQTERTLAERGLSGSDERYRALFESVDEGFCVVALMCDDTGAAIDYRFLDMNAMFEQHTGLRGAIGRTARELAPDLNQFWYDVHGRVATTGVAEHFVKVFQKWNDRLRPEADLAIRDGCHPP